MKFSITIDCYPDGKLEVRDQRKEKLPDKDLEKLERIKARVKKMIKEEALQPELLST